MLIALQHNIGTRRSEMLEVLIHAFFGGGTSGFWGGQVVLVIHLSVGQVDFFTKFEPCMWIIDMHGSMVDNHFNINTVPVKRGQT